MKKEIFIVGAGGHARNVVDAIEKQGLYTILGYCVDDIPVHESIAGGYPVLSAIKSNELEVSEDASFVIAIGNNAIRKELYHFYNQKFEAATVIHPTAAIATTARIGNGTVILANCTVNANSVLGENCLLNSNVVVDHDCHLGNHVHLRIGTLVSSFTKLEDELLSEIGQSVF